MDKETKMEQLDVWIHDLVYPGDVKEFIQVIKSFTDTSQGETQVIKDFCFYTNEFKYRFYANDRSSDDGYLGCQVTARKMRAGEDWDRGNDLADGSFDKETWNRILSTIINYELVMLSKFTKPNETPEDIEGG
jgi:hypothetical protein